LVTTAIALLAGTMLIAVSMDQRRFERVLVGAARLQLRGAKDLQSRTGAEPPLLRVTRLLTLTLGGICIALGAAGVWAQLR
jgi:hypothetical protein